MQNRFFFGLSRLKSGRYIKKWVFPNGDVVFCYRGILTLYNVKRFSKGKTCYIAFDCSFFDMLGVLSFLGCDGLKEVYNALQ